MKTLLLIAGITVLAVGATFKINTDRPATEYNPPPLPQEVCAHIDEQLSDMERVGNMQCDEYAALTTLFDLCGMENI